MTFRKPSLSVLNTKGFALVTTLSLMVLLTIIAVGLLTLSATTLRTVTLEAHRPIARANARLGMMMAIAELQRLVGPDQRVTAPADLQYPAARMARWVGVYANQAKASYDDAPSAIPSQPCKPVLLNWLVSGNEQTTFESSTSSNDFGTIVGSPGEPTFKPNDTFENLDDAHPLSSDIRVKGRMAALLVGNGSVHQSSGYIAAPIVQLTDSAKRSASGGYAYWVADEGMKARINLQDEFQTVTNEGERERAKIHSFVTPQRFGIEMMRFDNNLSSKVGAAYDPAAPDIAKLITTSSLSLLDPQAIGQVAKTRFHDITAYSNSILADTYTGGLKLDMSSVIAGAPGTPADSEPLFRPTSANDFGVPTWGKIRSWAQRRAPLSIPPPTMPAVEPHTAERAGFGPVITMASLGLGVERASGNSLRVQLFPTLILWNPHAVGIPAATYELGFGVKNGGAIDIELAKAGNGPWTKVGTFQLSGGDSSFSVGNGFFRFAVQGSEIPPGESHIYVLSSSNTRRPYLPGRSTLERAGASQPLGYNTRYLTGPSFSFNTTTFPQPYIRLNSTNTGQAKGLSSGDQLEVILTEPGALSGGFYSNTPVYQAILDLSTRRYSFPMAPKAISSAGLEPMTALRVQTMMEGRGGSNADWAKMGAMFQPGRPRGQERNRWLATTNPLAPYSRRTATESDLQGGNPVHGAVLAANHQDGKLVLNMNISSGSGTAYRSQIGPGHDTGNKPIDGILLDVLPTTSTLLSLGQLQHAPLSAFGFNTTYAFGNSVPDVRIPRSSHLMPSQVARPGQSSFSSPLYDIPWHVNRALWDRYFVSSAMPDLSQKDIDSGKALPNARLCYHTPTGKPPKVSSIRPGSPDAYREAAANLLVAGGFNINSTSVDAWRAVLTGNNGLTVPDTLAHPEYASTPLNAMMPRFSRDVRRTDANDSNGILNMWGASDNRFNIYRGNRELVMRGGNGGNESSSAASERLHEVAGQLAEKIVEEIRLRGPFLSLADFINRRLDSGDSGLRGTLQAAIDRTAGKNAVNPTELIKSGVGAFVDTGDSNRTITAYDPEQYIGIPRAEQGSSANSRTAMAPKHLTQADVLSSIGPALSARSDTFVIRSYGESLNSDGQPASRAWCEAVVQRNPEYIDPSDPATLAPANAKAANRKLGRQFQIVSFRWLSPDEI